MTAPQHQPAPTQPPVVQHHYTVQPSLLRTIVSVCETLGFVVASVLALMDNGQDFRHAITAALIAFVAHGVNHNSGGSPI